MQGATLATRGIWQQLLQHAQARMSVRLVAFRVLPALTPRGRWLHTCTPIRKGDVSGGRDPQDEEMYPHDRSGRNLGEGASIPHNKTVEVESQAKPVDSHSLDMDEQHQASAMADYGPATDAPPADCSAAAAAVAAEMGEGELEGDEVPVGTEVHVNQESVEVWETDASEQETQRMGQPPLPPEAQDEPPTDETGRQRRGIHFAAAPLTDKGAETLGDKASQAMDKVKETVAEAQKTVSATRGGGASGSTATPAEGGTVGGSKESHRVSLDTIDSHIIRDHAVIKLLYNDYLESLDVLTKERKVFALIYELARHSAVEELVLYEWLEQTEVIPNGADIARKNREEHQDLKIQVKALDCMAPHVANPDFLAELDQAMLMFVKHGDEEELKLLPLLRKHCSRTELLDLGEKYEHAASLVTTRPHPLAPTKGLSALAAHLSSKPLDLVRDWFEGRLSAVKEEAGMAERRIDRVLEHQPPPK